MKILEYIKKYMEVFRYPPFGVLINRNKLTQKNITELEEIYNQYTSITPLAIEDFKTGVSVDYKDYELSDDYLLIGPATIPHPSATTVIKVLKGEMTSLDKSIYDVYELFQGDAIVEINERFVWRNYLGPNSLLPRGFALNLTDRIDIPNLNPFNKYTQTIADIANMYDGFGYQFLPQFSKNTGLFPLDDGGSAIIMEANEVKSIFDVDEVFLMVGPIYNRFNNLILEEKTMVVSPFPRSILASDDGLPESLNTKREKIDFFKKSNRMINIKLKHLDYTLEGDIRIPSTQKGQIIFPKAPEFRVNKYVGYAENTNIIEILRESGNNAFAVDLLQLKSSIMVASKEPSKQQKISVEDFTNQNKDKLQKLKIRDEKVFDLTIDLLAQLKVLEKRVEEEKEQELKKTKSKKKTTTPKPKKEKSKPKEIVVEEELDFDDDDLDFGKGGNIELKDLDF